MTQYGAIRQFPSDVSTSMLSRLNFPFALPILEQNYPALLSRFFSLTSPGITSWFVSQTAGSLDSSLEPAKVLRSN